MSGIAIGVDLGTTKITALALESDSGKIIALHTVANDADITSPLDRSRGYSEWDPHRICGQAFQCLQQVAKQLGSRRKDVSGIGITGQQHGVVLIDPKLRPLTPLVNWQDRRGDELLPNSNRTVVQEAACRAENDALHRTGCSLASGMMGVTLFWWKLHEQLPKACTACFVMDYLAAQLTDSPPASDPTNAASSGVFDVQRRCWDAPMLRALELPSSLFPEIREANQSLGLLTPTMAAALDIPAGVPVFVPLGDSQAAFLGSVDDRRQDVLINVGTGAQVMAATDHYHYASPLETRPLPLEGNLLVSAQLCGGRAYAVLESFFHKVLHDLGGLDVAEKRFDAMNRLAENVPPGCEGLTCRPLFAGTRSSPELRASWSGVSPENFTPAHMTRALLEGVADVLYEDFQHIRQVAGQSYQHLVGSGNALRKNPLLCHIISDRFAMPLRLIPYEEEAALGAARLATSGSGASSAFR